MSVLAQLAQNLMKGKVGDVRNLTKQAIEEGIGPEEILNLGMIQAMNTLGESFKRNEIYIPEMLMAARAMKAGMEILQPKLTESGVEPIGTAVMGTVKGDLHDIGKNLVCMMLEGAGFKVIDVGIDVPDQKFVEIARANKASVIGISALLSTTMVNMKSAIKLIKASDIASKVKTMIGGAPVTQTYCDEIGADGYAPDAASAADLAKKLIG